MKQMEPQAALPCDIILDLIKMKVIKLVQVEFDVYAFSFSPETIIASLHNSKTNNTKPSHLKPNWIKKKGLA